MEIINIHVNSNIAYNLRFSSSSKIIFFFLTIINLNVTSIEIYTCVIYIYIKHAAAPFQTQYLINKVHITGRASVA